MLALIQRVSSAEVKVDGKLIAEIDQGILALIGIEKGDSKADARRLCERLLGYRIFSDNEDKMNLSLKRINGGLLLVPQFTLAADTQKGTRPSFSSAEDPDLSKMLFEYFCQYCSEQYPKVTTGLFGADMKVSLCNQGPVTFMLKVSNQ
ncbi:MAG: D-tyrosyl-tRNA(Tyr) deacylase [Gammaproteobacteria bacterium]|nr:MAG: D-tyrosyl-tRNA(Tyr) deacylase [Gammaproteobacteria bacterium]